jgi:urease accessory protein
LRGALAVFPGAALNTLRHAHPDRPPHAAVTWGAIGVTAGLGPRDIAGVAGYAAVSGPAAAAVRLLGLDPLGVARVLARLAPDLDRIAADAASAADRPFEEMPACSAPALDWLAESHAARKERLFAS